MGYSYNHGLVTPMKGPAIVSAKVTGLDGATQTIADQCRAGFYTAVTKGATGVYTFQLSLPYPPALVACHPSISNADGITDIRIPAYKTGSYNATTGQFIVLVMNDDDVGAPVLADGSATDELHVTCVFRRYTT
jgi:hypothetical protein